MDEEEPPPVPDAEGSNDSDGPVVHTVGGIHRVIAWWGEVVDSLYSYGVTHGDVANRRSYILVLDRE